MDRKTKIFEESRNELVNIAYGMLGKLSDAQDIVQDAYLRWSKLGLDEIDSPEKYLKTIVSNLVSIIFDRQNSGEKNITGRGFLNLLSIPIRRFRTEISSSTMN